MGGKEAIVRSLRAPARGRAKQVLLAAVVLCAASVVACRTEPSNRSAKPASSSNSTDAVGVVIPAGLVEVKAERLLTFIRNYAGKGVLLNVWASWCTACQKEVPKLMAMREEYAKLGLDMMFVSVDDLNEASKALAFLTQHTKELPSFIASPPLREFKAAIDPRWGGTLPATFLFDTKAKVRYFWATTAYEQELRHILNGFLKGKSIDGRSKVNVRVGEKR